MASGRIRLPLVAGLTACCLLALCLSAGLADSAQAAGPTYVVGTYDGSTLRLYLDGRQVATGKGTLTPAAPKAGEIGTFLAADVWHGVIDNVALYNRALAAGVIVQHYRAGRGRTRAPYGRVVTRNPALVSFWPLGDNGTAAQDATGRNPGAYRKGDTQPTTGLVPGPGRALDLKGTNGGVLIPRVNGVTPKSGFTLEAWVKADDNRDATIVTTLGSGFLKTNGFGQFGFGLVSADNKLDSIFSREKASTVNAPPRSRSSTSQAANRAKDVSGGGGGGSAIWVVIVGIVLLAGLGFAVRELMRSPSQRNAPADEDAP